MVSRSLLKEFERVVGVGNVFSEKVDLLAYSHDAAVLERAFPALVLRPADIESLGEAIKLCAENGLPLTPRGSGTNLSGGTIPSRGGAVVLTNALNRILEINSEDMFARVEPGVITAGLAAAAGVYNKFR